MFTCMILMTATLLVGGILAAGPLVLARMLRPAVQGAGGTLCVVAGAAAFFAVASGLAGNMDDGGYAVAAETTSDAAAAKTPDESAASAATSRESPGATSTSPAVAKSQDTSLNTLPQDLVEDVIIPPGRPQWVKSEPVREGSRHSTAVCSGPFKRDLDARQALDAELEKQTAAYIAEVLGSKLAPQFIRYDASQIKAELVAADHLYRETIESPTVGSMEQYHALIEFSPAFQEQARQRWNDVKAKWRLAQFGLFAGGVLLLLGTVFSYFRLDTATRGYYTGRLQFLSAAAILAIVGAGVILAQWIAWL